MEIDVKLSPNQKKRNLAKAFHKRETIVLRLSNNALTGSDTLRVPAFLVKRLNKSKQLKKGMDIKLSKTNIRKQVGGSLLSSILSLGKTFLPTIGKTFGLSALSGLASEGAPQIVKRISGKGSQVGGFIVPQNKMHCLIPYNDSLNMKQKNDLLNALQMEKAVHIKPTKTQRGGFLGTLLASIGIPKAVDVVKDLITGKGAPRLGKKNYNKGGADPRVGKVILPQFPPPFYLYPSIGKGVKKTKQNKTKQNKKGKGLLLGPNSPFKSIPILGAIL